MVWKSTLSWLLTGKVYACTHGRPQKIFQEGVGSTFCLYPFQVARDAMQIDALENCLNLRTPQRKCSKLWQQSQKLRFVRAARDPVSEGDGEDKTPPTFGQGGHNTFCSANIFAQILWLHYC